MYDRFAMNNTLSQLLREIIKIEDIPDIPISGISINSSDITPGELYIAIKGSNYDGHEFIPEAIKNGASAVITDNNYNQKFQIKMQDLVFLNRKLNYLHHIPIQLLL